MGEIKKKELIKGLGKQMKIIRTRNRLSQKEVAYRAGISMKQYQQYENGKRAPRFLTLHLLAGALGVHPSYLVA